MKRSAWMGLVLGISTGTWAQVPTLGLRIVNAARSQVGVTLTYDPAYHQLPYPGGDVPRKIGVCTDVVIRALRDTVGYDLQKMVHEDMTKHFAAYPHKWGLPKPDKNIDHRRVLNLQVFFRRKGWQLSPKAAYKPGDLVTVVLPLGQPHIMVVSDRLARDKRRYLAIHNIGQGTKEEDALTSYRITGHYRVK